MRKENLVQNIVIVVLAITVLVMSVGYAAYSQQLKVEGQATFSKAKWDVHFDTTTFTESGAIKATNKSVGNTTISYEVTLPKPGDTYSFTVDAKNFGTIDAKLTKITLSGLTDAQKKFVSYEVSYNGTTYTETTTGLSEALAADASHPMIVTVKYVLPSDATALPSENVTIDLTVALDYEDNAN